jgi:hypothetical protein
MPVRRVRAGGPGSFAEYERLVAELAIVDHDRRHDRGMVAAVAFTARRNRAVRLVEVTRSVTASGLLLPFHHITGPSSSSWPRTLILVHPIDWKRVEEGERRLPRGWDLTTARCIWRRRGA